MPRAKISTVDKERQVGGQLWLKRTRGRARRGHRAVQVVGGQRGPNITSVFAVSNIRSLILHEIFPRAMTGDRFVQFLSRVSTSSGNRRITFVFGNAPVHRTAGESAIAETHALIWLPPYSPFLNNQCIVEQAFSCWKAGLKRQLAEVQYQLLRQRNEERLATLCQLAEQSTAEVTPEKSQAGSATFNILLARMHSQKVTFLCDCFACASIGIFKCN